MKEDFNELLNMICPENDIFGCFEIAIDPPTMQEDEGDLKIHSNSMINKKFSSELKNWCPMNYLVFIFVF